MLLVSRPDSQALGLSVPEWMLQMTAMQRRSRSKPLSTSPACCAASSRFRVQVEPRKELPDVSSVCLQAKKGGARSSTQDDRLPLSLLKRPNPHSSRLTSLTLDPKP